jgi:hypothetical protein
MGSIPRSTGSEWRLFTVAGWMAGAERSRASPWVFTRTDNLVHALRTDQWS